MKLLRFAVALFLLTVPVAEAQNCGTLGMEVRGVQSVAFDEYPSLNDVKQGVLLLLYGRETADCPGELYDYAVSGKEYVLKFDDAYNLSKSNSSDARIRALNLSAALKETTDTMLKDTSLGASAQDIANSADITIRGFLITQGKNNELEGEVSNKTREKIEHYRLATIAYEVADESLLTTNTRIIWKRLEKEYLLDMQRADELYSSGEEKFGNTQNLSRDIPSRITAYSNTKEVLALFQEALVLYTYHEETEKILETRDNLQEINSLMASLRAAIEIYFLVLAIFLIGISIFLLNRILAWREDNYEHYLGNELIRVKGVGR